MVTNLSTRTLFDERVSTELALFISGKEEVQ